MSKIENIKVKLSNIFKIRESKSSESNNNDIYFDDLLNCPEKKAMENKIFKKEKKIVEVTSIEEINENEQISQIESSQSQVVLFEN